MTQPPTGWSTPGEPPAEPPPPPPPPGYGYPPYGQPAWGQPQWGAPIVTPGVVPLRPLTVGEVLDGAVKVIRRYARPTLGMSAIVATVTTVLNVLAVLATDYSTFAEDVSTDSSDDPFGSSGSSALQIPGLVVGSLAGIVLTGCLVVVVGKGVLGQSLSFGDTWQQVKARIFALLGLALLTGLLSYGPLVVALLVAFLLALASPVTLVLGIPLVIASGLFGVYLYVRLSLAPAALVLEKAGIRDSMTRSGVLVKGDWWRVFGILLLVQLLAGVVSSVLEVPFVVAGGINAFANPDAGGFTTLFVVTQVGAGLAAFLVTPFVAGSRALLYVDRRMRAEGLDLALQAAARG